MSIDRVATNAQAQFMLNQINSANVALTKSQEQVRRKSTQRSHTEHDDQATEVESLRSRRTEPEVRSVKLSSGRSITFHSGDSMRNGAGNGRRR